MQVNTVRSREFKATRAATLLLCSMLLCVGTSAQAEVATRVFLNGSVTPVYFNDGDSFRVLAGPLKGTKARLKGYNTLESYGPVHQWSTWTREELSNYSKVATLFARKGVWTCTSDMKQDTYGRILWDCRDLAIAQLQRGLAHAMTVTKDPADKDLLDAQREAIAERRGFWSHGVPEYILTSVHSANEGYKNTYNRLVSTADGHSKKWFHETALGECDVACQPTKADPARIQRYVSTLRQDASLRDVLAECSDDTLSAGITQFVETGFADGFTDPALREALKLRLLDAVAQGTFSATDTPASCMVNVAYTRRYGGSRAECLR